MANTPRLGFWKTAQMYQHVQGLPVMRAHRSITGAFIKTLVESGEAIQVLSLGIGNGTIYRDYFAEPIKQGQIELVGVDLSLDMLMECAAALDVKSGVVTHFSPDDDVTFPLLLKMDILELIQLEWFDAWAQNRFDFIEAGLVLHHIPYQQDLIELFNKVFGWLSVGGTFVLGDTDVAVGSYLEKKEAMLREAYPLVTRDSVNAVFVCQDHQGQAQTIPLLDENYAPDSTILRRMDEKMCNPLREEAQQTNHPDTIKFVEENITSAHQGLEPHRSVSAWIALIAAGAGQRLGGVDVISTETIRQQFPDVRDSPFVIRAWR